MKMSLRFAQLTVSVVMLLNVTAVYSQAVKTPTRYIGMDAGMGMQFTRVKSNINALQNIEVISTGGTAGIVAGSPRLTGKLAAGFYYSDKCPQTVDRFTSHLMVIYYPLQTQNRIKPYILMALIYNQYKFAGQYLQTEYRTNNSVSGDLYIGRLHQINIGSGIGVEYRMESCLEFLTVYLESRMAQSISSQSDKPAFDSTDLAKATSFQFGFRVGVVSRK